MRRQPVLAAFVLLVSLSWPACRGASPFCTYAKYEAPRSGYAITVFGRGLIPAGHDVSGSHEGTVLICPLTGETPRGIRWTTSGKGTIEFALEDTGETGTHPWDWSSAETFLKEYLSRVGFGPVDAAEIAETARVVNGVMAGPKGTVLDGQTDVLRVVDVDYRYERCSEEMSSDSIRRLAGCSRLAVGR